MRTLSIILLFILLFSSCNRRTKVLKKQTLNDIYAIDTKFPLRLNTIDFANDNNSVHLNDGINSKIEQTVKDCCKRYCYGYDDSTFLHSYKDDYVGTIRLHDSLHTIFLVLCKNYPSEEVDIAVALFYDNQRKEFADTTFDLKLWVLYDFNNGKFISSYLKKLFNITTPEIEIVNYNNDKVSDYKFTRLWHNGTFNAIETSILTINNNELNTLLYEVKPIETE